MKKLLTPILLIIMFSCGTVHTFDSYDENIDFSSYKTYGFVSGNLLGDIDQFNRERILNALEADLAQKGFVKSENPDILVDIFLNTKEEVTTSVTPSGGYGMHGYGGYGRYGYGGGFTTAEINEYESTIGTLIIDIVDNASQKIAWHGSGTKTLKQTKNMRKREAYIQSAVQKILHNFPPKSH